EDGLPGGRLVVRGFAEWGCAHGLTLGSETLANSLCLACYSPVLKRHYGMSKEAPNGAGRFELVRSATGYWYHLAMPGLVLDRAAHSATLVVPSAKSRVSSPEPFLAGGGPE